MQGFHKLVRNTKFTQLKQCVSILQLVYWKRGNSILLVRHDDLGHRAKIEEEIHKTRRWHQSKDVTESHKIYV